MLVSPAFHSLFQRWERGPEPSGAPSGRCKMMNALHAIALAKHAQNPFSAHRSCILREIEESDLDFLLVLPLPYSQSTPN